MATNFSARFGGGSWLLLGLSALIALVGCHSPARSVSIPPQAVPSQVDDAARLNLFLTLKDPGGPRLRIDVDEMEVFVGDTWLPAIAGRLQLDSAAIGSTQVFIGAVEVPPGQCQRVRLSISAGAVARGSGELSPVPVEPQRLQLSLPAPLSLDRGDSRCLFLVWDVWASLPSPLRIEPVLTLDSPLNPLLVDLLYAACPDINTIFVIRTDKNWVVDSIGVGGRPTYLALAPDGSRQGLYVLASQEAALKLLDLSSQRVLDRFPLPLSVAPSFMTISPDGRWAYVLEERGGFLTQLDLELGRAMDRVRVDNRPSYAAYLAGPELLAVSSALSQEVVLFNPRSLTRAGSIFAGAAPQGLLELDEELYVADSGNGSVSTYDLTSFKTIRRAFVGSDPRRLLSDGRHVYVSNYRDGSLSVLVPGHLGAIQEVLGLRRPLEMVFEPKYRRVFVGDEGDGAVAVVDANLQKVVGKIRLGAKPLGLAVLR